MTIGILKIPFELSMVAITSFGWVFNIKMFLSFEKGNISWNFEDSNGILSWWEHAFWNGYQQI